MVSNGSATVTRQDVFRAAAALADKAEYGTLVLDGFGKIRSCGAAAARMLGCGPTDVAGKSVSQFVADFSLSESSLSYSTRYIAHLCADGGWRRFTAVDARGNGFPVDVALSRVTTEGQDFFLLNLRRLDAESA
jgi:PAS domain S-box-containing protein